MSIASDAFNAEFWGRCASLQGTCLEFVYRRAHETLQAGNAGGLEAEEDVGVFFFKLPGNAHYSLKSIEGIDLSYYQCNRAYSIRESPLLWAIKTKTILQGGCHLCPDLFKNAKKNSSRADIAGRCFPVSSSGLQLLELWSPLKYLGMPHASHSSCRLTVKKKWRRCTACKVVGHRPTDKEYPH